MRRVVSYPLARVVPARDRAVYRELTALPAVKGVVLAYGVFDMWIIIGTDNIEELDHIVFNKIRRPRASSARRLSSVQRRKDSPAHWRYFVWISSCMDF